MPNIKAGIATKLGIFWSVLLAVKPASEQIVALVENTAVHWTGAEKTGLITAAIIAGVTILGRMAQAVAAILKGKTA